MSKSEEFYTYRAGRKIALGKSQDQFVVRVLPERLKGIGIPDAEQVSSASSRVTTRASDLEPLMDRARHMAPTHHAYYVTGTGEEFLITDRIFVTFRQALSDDQVDAFTARYGLIKKRGYTNRGYLFQLTDHTGMNPVKLVVKLTEDDPLVESAEHDLNRRIKTYQLTLPADPYYLGQWHLHKRLNDAAFDPRASSRCEEAWQLLDNFGSPNVVVGITDDGFKISHPDLNSPEKLAGWGYFRGERLITKSDIDADPIWMYEQGQDHGTSCAGVIAGEVDAALTVGAAPGARLLPIKWESFGPMLSISDSKMVTVLDFIADKVDILSNSWGGVPDNTWAPVVIDRIRELAQRGGRKGLGILFIWAAGNENCPINHTAPLEVPYTNGWKGSRWVGVRTSREFRNNLVGIPGVIHVAALASNARRSHYSNYGPGIMVCAPTSNIHEYRRLTVEGLGITTTTGSDNGVTQSFGGTSSATPLVAGIAALVLSANPDLSAAEVVSILKKTASKDLNLDGYPPTPPANYDPDPSWDVSPISPFNRGDYFNNGDHDGTWSPWFGHGRVDAPAAVAEAIRRRGGPAGQTIRKNSMPGLAIPDNYPAGIVDTINFSEDAIISSTRVRIDITHTYIGDLRLTLTAPSGISVLLHNRNGGGADNIKRVFDLSSVNELGKLVDQSIKGIWTLTVQDLASLDDGQLNRWELEFDVRKEAIVELGESPGLRIPDNDPNGIERTLSSSESGRVKDAEVSIDVTHTYIGDLAVTLISPSGKSIYLHNRTGGSLDNLIKTYTSATDIGLRAIRGEAVNGMWRLKVADLEVADEGKLNQWALKIFIQQ